MKIALGTIEVSDDERRALAHYYGEPGLADRETIRRFVIDNGRSVIEQDLLHDLLMAVERGEVEWTR